MLEPARKQCQTSAKGARLEVWVEVKDSVIKDGQEVTKPDGVQLWESSSGLAFEWDTDKLSGERIKSQKPC